MLRPILICVLLASLACGGGSDAGRSGAHAVRSGPPVVVVTFHPTQYLVTRLAGELVRVVCDVPPDADALFWEPDRRAVQRMQRADLIVFNGAGLERWTARVSLPLSRVLDSSAALAGSLLEYEDTEVHSHGVGAQHAHTGVDAHVWLDPRNALEQARAIHAALARILPGAVRGELNDNLASLESDLLALDARLVALSARLGEQHLYASHPAYGYLRARYGWHLVDLDLDPAQMPSDETLEALRGVLAQRPGRLILWESEPAAEIAARLLELGLTGIVYSPAESLGPAERAAGLDFLAVQRANVEALEASLE